MSLPPRVVTFGELLLRLTPPRREPLLHSAELRANFGGAEANVAVSLAHLGHPVSYVTALPDNALGGLALAALRAEGVEVRSREIRGSRLGLFFVDLGTDERPAATTYDRAHSAFSQVNASSFAWLELLSGVAWFHCTGITPALGSGPAGALGAAVSTARYLQVPVSVDLNYRPALWSGDPGPSIAPLAQGADLLIGSQSAFAAMLGLDSGELSRIALATGAQRVALTRREVEPGNRHRWSASLYDVASDTLHDSTVYRVPAVDRVGGGDSFAAALLSQLLRHDPLERALALAVLAGAHKLGVSGDWSRLDSPSLERLLEEPDPAWS